MNAPLRTTSRCRRWRWWPIAAVAVLAALAPILTGCGGSDETFGLADVSDTRTPADIRFVIPAGTGVAIDAGEPVEIIPADLTVEVGDVLELDNEDDRGHIVGPFYVGAGETLRQRFSAPGEFVGVCTVHPSGQVTVTVVEP